jgi:hypothetical protein
MIFVGWRSQEYIFMKENFEFKTAFQIHSNWTHHHRVFYIAKCVKLMKKRQLWC